MFSDVAHSQMKAHPEVSLGDVGRGDLPSLGQPQEMLLGVDGFSRESHPLQLSGKAAMSNFCVIYART